jgi:hypothetical protein
MNVTNNFQNATFLVKNESDRKEFFIFELKLILYEKKTIIWYSIDVYNLGIHFMRGS